MSDLLKSKYCYPQGEVNYEGDVEATEYGIECSDLGINLSWEWIDAAREELRKREAEAQSAEDYARGEMSDEDQ